MSLIVDRISSFIDARGLSIRQLEMSIGASNGALSRAIKEGKDIQAKWISIIVDKYPDLNADWLLKGRGDMILGVKPLSEPLLNVVNEPQAVYRAVGNIHFVPVKARAGYLTGYADAEYVEELPSYRLPGFNNGSFRAFEVEGDSMYQFQTKSGLHPGSWVISERVERAEYIRDSRVYVIVSEEGVIVKRCINRLAASDPLLICQSDNKSGEYTDILLSPDQIWEVWEFKAAITRHIPPPSDIYQAVIDLQARMSILEHKHLSK